MYLHQPVDLATSDKKPIKESKMVKLQNLYYSQALLLSAPPNHYFYLSILCFVTFLAVMKNIRKLKINIYKVPIILNF